MPCKGKIKFLSSELCFLHMETIRGICLDAELFHFTLIPVPGPLSAIMCMLLCTAVNNDPIIVRKKCVFSICIYNQCVLITKM